jgi:hypothetical protein
MNESLVTGEPFESGATERRRLSRVPYSNPHLITLLRHSGEIGRALRDGTLEPSTPYSGGYRSLSEQAVLLSDTISLIDGACQVGMPRRSEGSEDTIEAAGLGPFFDDQLCYVEGMAIATARGAVAAETLILGDVVLTHSGKRRVRSVSMFTLHPASDPLPERGAPVQLRRGAIATNLPGIECFVSPTHCLWISGRLVPARLLLNGTSIVQKFGTLAVTYCHVQFDRPAHGLLADTPKRAAALQRRLAARGSAGDFPDRSSLETESCASDDG